jgi:hypothetical protein
VPRVVKTLATATRCASNMSSQFFLSKSDVAHESDESDDSECDAPNESYTELGGADADADDAAAEANVSDNANSSDVDVFGNVANLVDDGELTDVDDKITAPPARRELPSVVCANRRKRDAFRDLREALARKTQRLTDSETV